MSIYLTDIDLGSQRDEIDETATTTRARHEDTNELTMVLDPVGARAVPARSL